MSLRRGTMAFQSIRTLFDVGVFVGLSDGQLLQRFNEKGGQVSESAFATLVERHGGMVFRVCRSILRDEHDSQDAFQATFIVLARKAGSLRMDDSLGPWLYRVALRASIRAKHAAQRRREVERMAADLPARPPAELDSDDLSVLHEEIDKLPERYRVPIVLCDLQEQTYERAAQQLGWSIGTIKSRLARGRSKLRTRLARRGLGSSAGVLVAGLSAKKVWAGPPAAWVRDVVRSVVGAAGPAASAGPCSVVVASLVEGVISTMRMSKLMMAAAPVAVVLGVATFASGVVAQQQSGLSAASDSERLRQVETKLEQLLERVKSLEPADDDEILETPSEKAKRIRETKAMRDRMLVFPKQPLARMVLAVNSHRERKIVILQEWLMDLSNLDNRKKYIEYLHFSIKTGRACYADGRPISEETLWDLLPNSPSSGIPVVVATDEEMLRSPYFKALRSDTIVLIGETKFQAVGSLSPELE